MAHAPEHGSDADTAAGAADSPSPRPGLSEALRELGVTGHAGLAAAGDAAKALRSLVSADFSLARSAFGRTLALTGVAIALGASAWLLLMSAMIVLLSRQFGLPWVLSTLIAALLSIAITVLAAWQAMRYFEHTRMRATRRQLARLGLGELADFMPDAGDAESSREAEQRHPPVRASGAPLKDERGVDVTPP